jgi:hypothetical protein
MPMPDSQPPYRQPGYAAGSDGGAPYAVTACVVGEPSSEVVATLDALRERGVLSQTLKLSFEGSSATAIDSAGGATPLMPDLGPIQGAADAVWRAQSLMTGDTICIVECPLVASLTPEAVERVVDRTRAAALVVGGPEGYADPEGWLALINEITIKPLLAGYAPSLADLIPIPLTGVYAIARTVLRSIGISNGDVLGIDLLFRVAAAYPDAMIAYVPGEVSHSPLEPAPSDKLANEALRVAANSYYARHDADPTRIDDKRVQLRTPSGDLALSTLEIGERPPFKFLQPH